jgi:hypothetical protein
MDSAKKTIPIANTITSSMSDAPSVSPAQGMTGPCGYRLFALARPAAGVPAPGAEASN